VTPLARGVGIALLGIGVLTCMDAVAKGVVSGELHLMQIMFTRSVIVSTVLASLFALRGRLSTLRPVRMRASILRAAVGLLAPFCFFASLRYLPLTDATVVAYNSVFVITILSALLLGERVGAWRWSAVAVGYLGVVIALEPGGEGSALGYALVLVASVSYASLAVAGKWLGSSESSASLVLVFNATIGLVCLPWLPFVFRLPSVAESLGLLGFALMAVSGQWLLTDAYRRIDGSLLAPLEYTSLVWVVVLDILIWRDPPGARTLTGAAIIIAASLVVIYRERRRALQSRPRRT